MRSPHAKLKLRIMVLIVIVICVMLAIGKSIKNPDQTIWTTTEEVQ